MSERCGVVVAHGHLAEGLLSALERVAGERQELWPVSNSGLGSDELYEKVARLLEDRAGGRDAYLFSDMDGGSCGQTCRRLLADGRVRAVFFGVNLPLLVEFVFLREEEPKALVRTAVEKSRKALGARP